jgi:hypothetical protein
MFKERLQKLNGFYQIIGIHNTNGQENLVFSDLKYL